MRVNLARKGKKGSRGFDMSLFSLDGVKDLFSFGSGSVDVRAIFNNYFLKAGVVAIIYFAGNAALTAWKQDELSKVRSRVEMINQQRVEIETKLAKIKGFEPIRQRLEADEGSLRTKITILLALNEGRNAPAKMLLEIAKIIPPKIWLTSLKISESQVNFSGMGVSHEVISDFVNALSSTSFFYDVTIRNISENMSAENDQRFQRFELDAKRRQGT